jgi:ketosteroid isomerase-like protein
MDEAQFDQALDQYHRAAGEFVKGNPKPYKAAFSLRDDVTLGNPFGPFARGWDQVAAAMDRAAANYRDGEIAGFESLARLITPELAYIVEVERLRAKIGANPKLVDVALRATSVLRREEGVWKVVHRHADPITTARGPETLTQT